jgi:hypothetical protein
LRQQIEKPLAVLGVVAVDDDLVESSLDQCVDSLQDLVLAAVVDIVTLLELVEVFALLLTDPSYPRDGVL